MEYIYTYDSPLGTITIAGENDALTGLWTEGQKYFASSLKSQPEEKLLPVFKDTIKWLDIYFSGHAPDFTPPLKLKGTSFQLLVWEILLKIPYGETVAYKDIARKVADKKGISQMSPQAVGGAVGHNPISIIVPCHRVVGSNGSLTGYAGGIDKKLKLLTLEKADVSNLFIPNEKIVP